MTGVGGRSCRSWQAMPTARPVGKLDPLWLARTPSRQWTRRPQAKRLEPGLTYALSARTAASMPLSAPVRACCHPAVCIPVFEFWDAM